MNSTRILLAAVAVLVVVAAGLFIGLNEQRSMVYLNPSTGAKVTTASAESYFGGLGGVLAAEDVADNTLFVSISQGLQDAAGNRDSLH